MEWEWTILLDTFNEILAHSVTSTKGSNKPYYHCLDVLKQLMVQREEQTSQVVFHTDQELSTLHGLCQAHKDYNILRSMSRVGTPTDNPIIEALNGWIKEELFQIFFRLRSGSSIELLNRFSALVELLYHMPTVADLSQKRIN